MNPDPATADGGRPVVLTTINARYSHASLGLRYLLANAGDMADAIELIELVGGRPLATMAERLLTGRPRIIAFGVYIWNVRETEALIRALKARQPELTIVLGGPEVSHELDGQTIAPLADYVIQGPGDLSFGRLIRQLLIGPRPLQRVIAGEQPALDTLTLPYALFSERDLRERTLYVEASRGCPFKCEFCLSALDRTAWPFPLAPFMVALSELYERGARRFKFVDRTFNLKPATSVAILEFFLARIERAPEDPCFVHFELVPDHLPDSLKAIIQRFPAGTLQFEIGIQTFDPVVQKLISRRQDNDKAEANLRWLREHSHAHLHVDLIAGLPGETLTGFGAGFNRLMALAPHEIQLGLLKRLRGAPIARHTASHALDFDPLPPYTIRSTAALPADDVAALAVMADFHDRIVNSGRLPRLSQRLLAGDPFARFLAAAQALHRRFGRRHGIDFESLVEALVDWLDTQAPGQRAALEQLALADYVASGARGRLGFMAKGLAGGSPGTNTGSGARADIDAQAQPAVTNDRPVGAALPSRQRHHLTH